MDGVAQREADGSQTIAVGTRIEVLSKDYAVPSIYVVTLSTVVDGEGAGDVIIEGARIDPEDPDGGRTLDPFRLVLPVAPAPE